MCASHFSALCGYRARVPLLAVPIVLIWLAVGLVKPFEARAQVDTFSAYLQEESCSTADPQVSTPEATALPFASGQNKPTQVFLTFELNGSLAELLAAPRSLLIDATGAGVGTTVACGDIIGADIDGRVVIVISSVETGGLVGVGVLRPIVDDASRVSVEIHLVFAADGAPITSNQTPETDDGEDAVDDDDASDAPEEEPEGGV